MNKKAVRYRHILVELKQIATNRGKTFSPVMMMSDFESGVLPVIKSEVSIDTLEQEFILLSLYLSEVSWIQALRMFLSFLSSYLSPNATAGYVAGIFHK